MRPLALVTVVALLAACGDGSSGRQEDGGVVPDAATVDAFASQLWSAARARRIALTAEHGPTAEYRAALYGQADFQARLREQAASGLVLYQASLVPACLAEVTAAADVQALYDARFDPARPCRRAFHGSSTAGFPCVRSADCAAGTYCLLSGACPGTCTPKGTTGTPCSADQNYGQCGWGFACMVGVIGSTSGTCISTRVGVGGACGAAAGNAFCLQNLTCVGGTCAAQGGPGAPCAAAPYSCNASRYCDGSTCQPRVLLGAVCTPGTCQNGTYCDATGHCAPAPGPGEACAAVADGGEYRGCLVGSCLTDSTCQLVHDPGQACSSMDVCKYTSCNPVSGRCGDGCG